ncbi:MAG TPA: response regulator, partial [Polyangiaceae bacterium]|nr:response regulator [Polyangiaceae bacterium]
MGSPSKRPPGSPSKRPPAPGSGARPSKIPPAPKLPSKRPPPAAAASTKPPTSGRKRVLVVEDDQAIRTMLAKALGVQYEVIQAENGAVGLAMASKYFPDLILTDVMMPQLDGYGLATRVRMVPQLAKVPILFLTAKGSPTDVIKGIQLGARHYVVKPFQLKDVLQKV